MAEFWVRQEKRVYMKAGREEESSRRVKRLKMSRIITKKESNQKISWKGRQRLQGGWIDS